MNVNQMFAKTNVLKSAMDAAWLREKMIANNIANVDTPGYKRKDVAFENILSQNIQKYDGKVGKFSQGELEPQIITPKSNNQIRLDGNNVDIDVEMAEQAKNQLRYYALIEQTSKQLQRFRTVLNAK